MIKYWQRIRATNDTNGNPRRLFMVYLDKSAQTRADILGFHFETFPPLVIIEEGYEGKPPGLPPDKEVEEVNVSYNELRRLKKRGDLMSASDFYILVGE